MASNPADLACAKHSARGMGLGKITEQMPLTNAGGGCGAASAAWAKGRARTVRRVMLKIMAETPREYPQPMPDAGWKRARSGLEAGWNRGRQISPINCLHSAWTV